MTRVMQRADVRNLNVEIKNGSATRSREPFGDLEALAGFEPANGGFANLSLNHLGIAPSGMDSPCIAARGDVKPNLAGIGR